MDPQVRERAPKTQFWLKKTFLGSNLGGFLSKNRLMAVSKIFGFSVSRKNFFSNRPLCTRQDPK